MKKAIYTAPALRILAAETESDTLNQHLISASYYNADKTYLDETTDHGWVLSTDLPEGVEVGAKEQKFDVWE